MKTNVLTMIAILGGAGIGLGGGFVLTGCTPEQGGGIGGIASGLGAMTGGAGGGGDMTMGLIGAGATAIDAMRLSPEDEMTMGQSVAINLTNKHDLVDNEKLTAYVTKVGLTVAGAQADERNYTFGVVDTSDVGAYSGPGGYILITRGALELMEDESELAGVLAHEIGHVQAKHGLNAVRNQKLTKAGVQAGTSVAASEMDPMDAQLLGMADGVVENVLTKGYGRGQEGDADKRAVDMLVKAGYDPQGLSRFLQKLEEFDPSGGKGGVMSTHPGRAERMKKIEAQIAKLGNPAGATLADRFKKSTRLKA